MLMVMVLTMLVLVLVLMLMTMMMTVVVLTIAASAILSTGIMFGAVVDEGGVVAMIVTVLTAIMTSTVEILIVCFSFGRKLHS